MKTFFAAIGILFVIATTSVAQSGFDPDKLVLGGAVNFSFSNNYSSVTIAPQVGYTFNRFITFGGGVNYNYHSYSSTNTSLNYLGLNVYGRFNPIQYIALQVQPEGHYMWGKYSGLSETRFIPSVLVGGGITIPAGRSGGLNAMIYYDVVQYKSGGVNYSPYGNKVVYSVGYTFGF